ncbi:MAG: hypothetical protein TH68_03555 [Candidatus Synechococcus spongiarum 142]|uniref:Uncharacterized protein n=1 Tax=Candidatus Synechococcus spongiarum 142 TaxID=1608213 RepID=A0A6N3X1A7_9SYNE|nr:MAG: hypothetical protein TH68_03555 [Candidatus Synechococcus spongiarum 142]
MQTLSKTKENLEKTILLFPFCHPDLSSFLPFPRKREIHQSARYQQEAGCSLARVARPLGGCGG